MSVVVPEGPGNKQKREVTQICCNLGELLHCFPEEVPDYIPELLLPVKKKPTFATQFSRKSVSRVIMRTSVIIYCVEGAMDVDEFHFCLRAKA